MNTSLALPVAAVCAASLAACTEAREDVTGEWQAAMETAGSVTTVRTLSGSVWRDTATLREEASIGQVRGDDAYLLGNVVGVTAHAGRIYVLDDQVPVLRVYDFQGTHVRDIGREGDGPGEFRNPAGLDVRASDGRIFVYDGSQGRITVFSADGEAVETRRTGAFNSYVPPITVSNDGTPYVPQLLNPGDPPYLWRKAMMAYGPGGVVRDSLKPPEYEYEPPLLPARGERSVSYNRVPFSPAVVWTMTPRRAIVSGVSGTYRFRVQRPDGAATVIERASWEPVPVLPDEAAWHRRFMTVMNRAVEPGWVWSGPPIPEHQPAFSHLIGDRSGRIWVGRPGRAERLEGGTEDSADPGDFWFNPLWRDRPLVDVFDRKGRYLGPVKVPSGFRLGLPRPHIDGDLVIAVVEGEDGVQCVKRFTLLIPRPMVNVE